MDWTESVRKCHGQLMPTPFAPHRVSVCLVAVPEMATGVLNGLYEVFSFVGTGWELLTGWPTGPRRFLPRIVAEDRTPFRNLAGLPIAPDLTFAEAKRADIVIVGDLAVGRDEETRGRWPAEVAWLRQQQAQGALICSVCTGALMLAEAGLLDGEEATCHWAAVDQIGARYPEVRLRPERVLVPAGVEHRLVTAGAAASWTDLALYLIARFCGEDEARRTAKLFLFGDRSDGQLPFAARVRPPQHDDAAVSAAQLWIAENYVSAEPGGRDDPRLRSRAAHLQAPLPGGNRLRAARLRPVAPDRGGQADARDDRRADRSDCRRGRLHRTRRLSAHLQASDRDFTAPVSAAVPLGCRGVSS